MTAEVGLLDGLHAALEGESAVTDGLLEGRVRASLRRVLQQRRCTGGGGGGGRPWEEVGRLLRAAGVAAWPRLGVTPAVVALVGPRDLPPLDMASGVLRAERRPGAWLPLFVAVVRQHRARLGGQVAPAAWSVPPGTVRLALCDATWSVASAVAQLLLGEADGGAHPGRREADCVDRWQLWTVAGLLALADHAVHGDEDDPDEQDAVKRAWEWACRARARWEARAWDTRDLDGLLLAGLAALRERLGGRLTPDLDWTW